MDNFDDFENKSYEPAREVKYTVKDHLNFILKFAFITFQVALTLISELFAGIINLFASKKPKDITGQLALVTGFVV